MNVSMIGSWPRRAAPFVLSVLILAGVMLLLGLVMELQDPAWSRPAIALQLLAVAFASAALGARWRLSRRFVIYPLVLAAVIYLWDTTLPPPSLPDGLLRVLVPRLALLAIVIDATLMLRRQRAAIALARALAQHGLRFMPPATALRRHLFIRRGLVPLDEVAGILHVSADELRARLGRHGGVQVAHAGREHIRLEDLLQIVAHWSAADRQERAAHSNGHAPKPIAPPHARNLRDPGDIARSNGHTQADLAHGPRRAHRQPSAAANRLLSWRNGRQQAGAPSTPRAEFPRGLARPLGVCWFVLTAIVALAPGVELRLIADGHAPSVAIFACLQPWVALVMAGAALVDLLTLWIAIWVVPFLRRTALFAFGSGTAGGVGLGALAGDPCRWLLGG